MSGFFRRIGHQITQCAPVAGFAWVAGQASSPAGAATSRLAPSPRDDAAADPAGAHALAASATPGAACPVTPVPAAVSVAPAAAVAAPAPVLVAGTTAAAPAAVPHGSSSSAGASPSTVGDDDHGGPMTSYVIGPRTEYHNDIRYLQVDDRDTTVSQQVWQHIVAGGDVTTGVGSTMASGDHASAVHVALLEPVGSTHQVGALDPDDDELDLGPASVPDASGSPDHVVPTDAVVDDDADAADTGGEATDPPAASATTPADDLDFGHGAPLTEDATAESQLVDGTAETAPLSDTSGDDHASAGDNDQAWRDDPGEPDAHADVFDPTADDDPAAGLHDPLDDPLDDPLARDVSGSSEASDDGAHLPADDDADHQHQAVF